MNFIEELKWRGLFKDVTHEEELVKRLEEPIVLYCGFDPTAPSLHVGHLQQLVLLKRYQNQGHHPIALMGGGTGMIGDPRPTTERQLLDDTTLQANLDSISQQVEFILNSDNNPVQIMNNRDWLETMNVFEFLRDYGKYFSISNMLAKDTIASRLDTGISFTEFSYTILQAIDFLKLNEMYECALQIGGSDQWGNIVSGVELIRRKYEGEKKVYAVTSPLIMRADGTKFGKSEGKNVWLKPEDTDAYTFYQFWFNTSDEDILDFMKRLSMKSPQEIEAIYAKFQEEPHKRYAQIELAKELTELVHGKDGLESALKITESLFSGDVSKLSVEEIKLAFKDASTIEVNEDLSLIDLLVNTNMLPSRREARQLITGKAIRVNGEVIEDENKIITKEDAIGNQITVIKRGKKTYHLVEHK